MAPIGSPGAGDEANRRTEDHRLVGHKVRRDHVTLPGAGGRGEPMATSERGSDPGGSVAQRRSTGLARFAGLVMVLLGIVQITAGTTALLGGQVPEAAPRHLLSVSAATWGWIHLVLGAVVGLAGMAVITGQLWGRLIGILLVGLSMVASFASLSQHPAWSVLVIALGVGIIWALCMFDEAASAASPTMLD